ncbi:hypothetical protein TWF128_010895 [Orbilia oligospora]|nr:hypothetical protein TWF128_010895 [Orbilia oligospora]
MFVTPINYHDFKPRNPPKPLLLHQKQFRICILILKTNITSGERAKAPLLEYLPKPGSKKRPNRGRAASATQEPEGQRFPICHGVMLFPGPVP